MPRRSGLPSHPIHKRSKAPTPPKPRPARGAPRPSAAPAEELEQEREAGALVASDLLPESQPVARGAATFGHRRESADVMAATISPLATAAEPARARVMMTDYGYVVNEVRRIAITGGGIVLLLFVLSRFIH